MLTRLGRLLPFSTVCALDFFGHFQLFLYLWVYVCVCAVCACVCATATAEITLSSQQCVLDSYRK